MPVRHLSSASGLRERMIQILPEKIDQYKKLKAYGKVKLGDNTIGATAGGMRGLKCMLWDVSHLDPIKGIHFRGHNIPELQAKLPRAKGGSEPLPEGMLWLLMTGEIPTEAQAKSVGAELHARAPLPAGVEKLINSFPKNLHSMTQLSMAVLAMQSDSVFHREYSKGTIGKGKMWEPMFEDALNLIARLPRVAALIYNNVFGNGKTPDYNNQLDYSANFNRMLGFPSQGKGVGRSASDISFDDLMRLYLVIHADHEGGNVSAHTTRLVGTALSDAYLSFSGGLNGLAGPLHGLANQEVLKWTLDLEKTIKASGKAVTKESVEEAAWATLKAGRVIPGFGHAVLRNTDPRYMVQREFALKHLKNDPLFHLVGTLFEVIPKVLTEHGKTANPYPNVDAHSGCLLTHYGFTQYEYYTVLFGVSRAFGVLSQLVLDRAVGIPLERPGSLTTEFLLAQGAKAPAHP